MKIDTKIEGLLLIILATYISFLLSVLFLPSKTDPSLYILSALAQSQATLLVIVLGFEFLAPSNLASTYSLRIAILSNNKPKSLWIPFTLSIFYDLILMAFLEKIPHPLNFFMVLASILGAIVVCGYMFFNLTEIIEKIRNPVNIIDPSTHEEGEVTNQHISDFIVGSLKINDTNGYSEALSLFYGKEIEKHTILDLIDWSSEKQREEKIREKTDDFKAIVENIISISTSYDQINEKSLIELLNKIASSFLIVPNDLKTLYFNVTLEPLTKFIAKCVKKEYENATFRGIEVIKNMYNSTNKSMYISDAALESLYHLGKACAETKMENIVSEIITSIRDILPNLMNIPVTTIRKIAFIGLFCAEYRLVRPCENTINLLGELPLIHSCDKEHLDLIVDYLGEITIKSFENQIYSCKVLTLNAYEAITKKIITNELNSEERDKIIGTLKKWSFHIIGLQPHRMVQTHRFEHV